MNLFIVSTPIGNLKDITFRAIDTLKEVDIIAAEDTRHARKLLQHYEINTKLMSYHMHNEKYQTNILINLLKENKTIALISDAGTPCIADPGFLLVREAYLHDIKVTVIPGVSALTFAAVACGFPLNAFSFWGFLPIKKGKRIKILEKIKEDELSSFIYESPHKILRLLDEIKELFPHDTLIAIVREASKVYEEVIRLTIDECVSFYENRKIKGEIVLCIDARKVK